MDNINNIDIKGHITKNLMVLPWTKTVKKTMARAVVRKSSLYHILSSRTTAKEKPTAPLRQKLNTFDFLFKNQPETPVGNYNLLLPADFVGAELVHNCGEEDGDEEPVVQDKLIVDCNNACT